MLVNVYVVDSGKWDDQYAFHPRGLRDEQKVAVNVPDGSKLIENDNGTLLRTPALIVLTASKVVTLCRVGVEGFEQLSSARS